MSAVVPIRDGTDAGAANDDGGVPFGAMEPYRFAAGLNARVMLLADVKAWVETARPGQRLRWAVGRIPEWAKVPTLVNQLHAAHIVIAYRRTGAEGPEFFIQRLSTRLRAMPAPRPTLLDREKATLLEHLVWLAEGGRRCPTNFGLSRRLDIGDGDRVSYLLKLLRKDGAIRNDPSPWSPGRIITITATGKATTVVDGVRR